MDKVSHNKKFQQETPNKDKALAEARWLFEVSEHRRIGQGIEAKVVLQASVLSQPYATKLLISSDRKVAKVYCNCVYNKNLKCRHVANVLHQYWVKFNQN